MNAEGSRSMLEAVDHEELVAHNCRARHLKRMGVPVAMAEADADRFDWH